MLQVNPPLGSVFRKSVFLLLYTLFLCGLITGCKTEEEPQPAATPAVVIEASAQVADEQATTALRALADDVWNTAVESSTYLRLQEGLPINEFEDLTLEQYHEDQAKAAAFRTQLASIDSQQLSGDDLITYEILALQLEDNGASDDDFWLNFDITAYQAPYAVQFSKQALAAQQISDPAAADHYLKLVSELADILDQLKLKLDGQIERGIYLPKPALPSTQATWQGMGSVLPAELVPVDARLSALSAEQQAEFKAALDALITSRIVGGFERLLTTLGDDYEAQAPEAVGLSQYPGGLEVYKRKIRTETTLDLTPEEIHDRGLDAVADISARMAAIRNELGFEGTSEEFLVEIQADPAYIAQSPEEVEDRFMQYIHRIEPKLDSYFKYQPKAAYGVRRLPLAAEAGMTYGYYNPPTQDEPTGYYNYNASDLPNRSMVWAGSLIYHELLPGHHFHMATQDENEALQDFRKKYSVGAFTEGWAEYAASLAIEMGMYETPMELYGRYIGEIFLASRLVVDTGMNALGWSLQDARDYMSQYVIQSESEIASETLRYSTSIPAQALAYRLGFEKHWELRRKAEAALGDKFDIREYHNVVLSDGAKPLPVLEAKVDRYIADTLQ
jgi:uncharacterized protein (DUF885 family)